MSETNINAMTPKELVQWRDHYKVSQQGLADLLGVHSMTVSKWERGLTRIPAMVGLALETLTQQRARLVKRLREQRAIRQTAVKRLSTERQRAQAAHARAARAKKRARTAKRAAA